LSSHEGGVVGNFSETHWKSSFDELGSYWRSSHKLLVDITPPKLNLQWKGFSQNPNKNVGYKSTPIRYQIIIPNRRVTPLFILP
jgi:hypothetical protein